jgi:MFS transporter, PAT family, beta-lactamase induction signal transducer AmpG
VGMQWVVGAMLACVAFTVPTPQFFQYTLAAFWLMAFASATHDIAADGFYLHALPQHSQAAFVGIRSTFYRLAMIAGQGVLVAFAGRMMESGKTPASAWTIVFIGMALLFVCLACLHAWALPRPASDRAQAHTGSWFDAFIETFRTFFARKDILLVLAFLLTYRLAEAQIVKLMAPFLLDPASKGGIGLTTQQLGWAYGTVGVIALTVGGILGGLAISKHGLKFWLWPMLFAIHVPNLLYVWLAFNPASGLTAATAIITVEQFGYGFGFAGYLVYMMMIANGDESNVHKTAHYSLCTGFMALGMMLPGMVSGKIQEALGYPSFFIWVCVCTLPSVILAAFITIDPKFGRKA